MKKLAYVLFFLGSQAAWAQPFEGFYATGGLGATIAQFDVQPKAFVDIPGVLNPVEPGSLNIDASQAAGFVSFSYAHIYSNQFVLAAAFHAGFTHIESTDNSEFLVMINNGSPVLNYSTDADLELTNDFALLFKPGYLFKKSTLFYALVGPRWGNFSTSIKSQFYNFNGANTYTASASDSTSNYELGWTAGFGIQQLVTERFNLGLEYAYTSYSNIETASLFSLVSQDGIPLDGTSFVDSPDIDVSTNTLMLTFSYKI